MMETKLEIYYGPMMSGKSRALAEAGAYLSQQGLKVAGLQSHKNSRDPSIWSRDGISFPAAKISTLEELEDGANYDAFLVDEFHFFDNPAEEVETVKRLTAVLGKIVVIGTLDYSYKGEPWECFQLLSSIEGAHLVQLAADCDGDDCQIPARYTALYNDGRQVSLGNDILVDGPGVSYSPRCFDHFEAVHNPQLAQQ